MATCESLVVGEESPRLLSPSARPRRDSVVGAAGDVSRKSRRECFQAAAASADCMLQARIEVVKRDLKCILVVEDVSNEDYRN